MKYIVTDHGGNESIHLFPHTHRHDEVAKGLLGKPISAGSVMAIKNGSGMILKCFGESTTLDLPSRKEDTSLLMEHLEYF
jgi:hypothetical protein